MQSVHKNVGLANIMATLAPTPEQVEKFGKLMRSNSDDKKKRYEINLAKMIAANQAKWREKKAARAKELQEHFPSGEFTTRDVSEFLGISASNAIVIMSYIYESGKFGLARSQMPRHGFLYRFDSMDFENDIPAVERKKAETLVALLSSAGLTECFNVKNIVELLNLKYPKNKAMVYRHIHIMIKHGIVEKLPHSGRRNCSYRVIE